MSTSPTTRGYKKGTRSHISTHVAGTIPCTRKSRATRSCALSNKKRSSQFPYYPCQVDPRPYQMNVDIKISFVRINTEYPEAIAAAYDRLKTTIKVYLNQIHEIRNRICYNYAYLETIYLGLCLLKLLTLTRASHYTTTQKQVVTVRQIQGAHQIVLLLEVKIEWVKREVQPPCNDLESLSDCKLPAYSVT